jgi:hypothetical protein
MIKRLLSIFSSAGFGRGKLLSTAVHRKKSSYFRQPMIFFGKDS